jgi:hypothetical protein
MPLSHSPYFDYLAVPLLIFCLRICDMTLDTLRIIFMTKGLKRLAPIIGFFEILIWIVAITRIMQHLNNWMCYLPSMRATPRRWTIRSEPGVETAPARCR